MIKRLNRSLNEPCGMMVDWVNIILGKKKVSVVERIFFTLAIPIMPSVFIGVFLSELCSN